MRINIGLLALVACIATRAAAAPTARELLDQTRQLDTTRKWTDRVQRVKLHIFDRLGGERSRELVISSRKYPEDCSRAIMFFLSPPEVKGVGFLQWADPHGKDQQWLYLPELKRVRQISAGAKHESFMGTDFSYDDLGIIGDITDWTDRDARATLLRDEALDNRNCHVIEFIPTGKTLTYGRLLTWLTADDLVIVKFEMYDSTGRLEKRLVLSDIRNVGRIPTAFRMDMKNEQRGSHTLVELSEIKYDTGLGDEAFTQRSLEHGF
jgi:outer membrane lipoprotein-sorting protein